LWKRIFKSIKAIKRKEIKTNVGKTDGFSIPLSTTISSSSSFDVSKINKNVISICNDENMYVETSNAKSVKQNYCLFCSKLQTQLARHLETVHRNEPDVKKFAILPKRNTEKKKIIETLRRNGNF